MVVVSQEPISIKPVGVVVSDFKKVSKTYDYNQESMLYMREDLTPALIGLEYFSHLHVIYKQNRWQDWLRLIEWEGEEPPLTLPLASEPACQGVYSTRSPSRPSAIGSCVVELIRKEENRLYVKGLDAIDGTPILDIKIYIPHYDAFPLAETPLNWCMGNELSTTSRHLHWDTINVGLTLGLRTGAKALQVLGLGRGEAVRAEVVGGHFFAQGIEGATKFVPLTDNQLPLQVLEINTEPCVISTLPFTKESNTKGTVVKIYEDLDQLADVMLQLNRINMQLDYYKDELFKVNGTSYTIGNIVCSNERIAKLKTQALQVARSNSTVLITGESGTGKELFAHSIHNASNRRKEPFIKVNCSAIPGELAESELFGYEDGAFTGARKQGKPGKFELADGGTIFLDEIGDMPFLLQSKFLRVIQEKEVERVGDVKTRKVDVRIVAATNKDLKSLVSEGKFREDLYYRLNVIDLKIPPLRERKLDIPVLVDSFIRKYNNSLTKRVDGITEAALEVLIQYNWPGNIRELENMIEKILNYVECGLIDIMDLPGEIRRPEKIIRRRGQSLATIEQEIILTAIAEAKGNKTKAAKMLGISRSKLYEKLSESENK